MKPPLPLDEETRLEALHRYHILDTPEEGVYDNIARLATHICGVPIAAVTLVDEDRQWFKARIGLEMRQTPREVSFCAHAITEQGVTMVSDMREDPRFADNPLVTADPAIRFYAGAPLVNPDGHVLGTLCVMDREPGRLTSDQLETLHALSRHVICQMEMRHAVGGQALILAHLKQLQHETEQTYRAACVSAATYIFETVPDKAYLSSDAALARFYGYKTLEELFSQLDDI